MSDYQKYRDYVRNGASVSGIGLRRGEAEPGRDGVFKSCSSVLHTGCHRVLDRSTYRPTLSDAGKKLLPYCEIMLLKPSRCTILPVQYFVRQIMRYLAFLFLITSACLLADEYIVHNPFMHGVTAKVKHLGRGNGLIELQINAKPRVLTATNIEYNPLLQTVELDFLGAHYFLYIVDSSGQCNGDASCLFDLYLSPYK